MPAQIKLFANTQAQHCLPQVQVYGQPQHQILQ